MRFEFYNDAIANVPKLSVDGSSDTGIRLVAHQHEIDTGAAQFIDQDEHFAAGQTEHAVDTGVGDQFRCGCGRSDHDGMRRREPGVSTRMPRRLRLHEGLVIEA